MKKVGKKLVAITGAIAMMSAMFAGCGEKAVEQQSSQPQESTSQVESSTPEASSSSEEPVVEEFTYPMEGNHSFTALGMCITGPKKYYGESNMNLTEFTKEAERLTGIDIEIKHLPVTDKTNFNLAITEGNYPDVFEGLVAGNYTGGIAQAAIDGIIIPVEDLIDKYMPNLTALMEEYPIIRAELTMDDGHIYAFPGVGVYPEQGHATNGLIIRTDWLQECGLNMPTTIDELYNVLVAFKEKYGASIVSQTNLVTQGTLVNAFCPNVSAMWGEDIETGEAYSLYTDDGYRELLSTVAKWYAEGLIHPDFLTFAAADVRAKTLAGEVGVLWGMGGSTLNTMLQEADANNVEIKVSAMGPIAKDKDSQVLYNNNGKHIQTTANLFITDNCPEEKYEAICRYYDFMYTEEGIRLGNYGIEGVSYYINADGLETFTELMLHNPDGYTTVQMMGVYCRNHSSGYTGIQEYNYLRNYYMANYAASVASDIWSAVPETSAPRTLDAANYYTADEAEEITVIKTDVDTYFKEMRAKFIYGELDVNDDAVWADYVKTMENYGLGRWTEIVNSAVVKKAAALKEFGVE